MCWLLPILLILVALIAGGCIWYFCCRKKKQKEEPVPEPEPEPEVADIEEDKEPEDAPSEAEAPNLISSIYNVAAAASTAVSGYNAVTGLLKQETAPQSEINEDNDSSPQSVMSKAGSVFSELRSVFSKADE